MALRVVEVVLPDREVPNVHAMVQVEARAGPWQQSLEGGLTCLRLLFEAEESSAFVDEMQRRFGDVPGYHLMILPVTAALPRPLEEDRPRRFGTRGGGLTREELYAESLDMAKPGRTFYATVVLSTIVVAIGLLRSNPAVVIGGMVIAPLLGPVVALALATTLGDAPLLKRALRSNLGGIAVALAIASLFGALYRDTAFSEEILSRTTVAPSDLLLALASGAAGALALTSGVSSALVGVMVAVALLPPTTVVGLALGRGAGAEAGQAALLLVVNLLSVHLAATATFLVQGLRPRTWWDADRARRAATLALVTGGLLLAALALLLYLAQH